MRRIAVLLILICFMAMIPFCAEGETLLQSPVAEGWEFVVGIDATGHAVAAGDNTYGQCDVADWENLVSVAAGREHVIGLCEDGTVRFAGSNEYGQGDVEQWESIVMIAANYHNSYGLTADGRILCAGYNNSHAPESFACVASWTDVVWLAANTKWGVCAIDARGHILTWDTQDYEHENEHDYDCVTDPVQAVMEPFGFIALQSDGTVVEYEGILHAKEGKGVMVNVYEGYTIIVYDDGHVHVNEALGAQNAWENIKWADGHFAITRDGRYVSRYCLDPKEKLQEILDDYMAHELGK